MRMTSIKTRITIWYTALMLLLVTAVLCLIGTLSYRLSIDNIEKDVRLQVTQVSEKLTGRSRNVFESVEHEAEFKNVSIYEAQGKYLVGQYIYDVARVPFREGRPRRENVGGKEYIIYDVRKHGAPDGRGGLWIRGAESVNSTVMLGKSAVAVVLVFIPLILIFAVWGGYYITKKAFSPIRQMIDTANDICDRKDISKRIILSSDTKKDELYELSVTLNHMLDQIEGLVLQEKQFTSDASHELRTPISVILAQAEYLTELAENEKERELAGDIVLRAKQISALVSALLLLARIDQNRQTCRREKVDLGILAELAADQVRRMAQEKGITVSVESEENVTAEADEALMHSVLTNLLSNAVKYGKKNGWTLVTVKNIGENAEITVSDNGIGIAKEQLPKIWDRFYRVDDVRNDPYGSHGLGLSMVQSILRLHGGKITVESEFGKGTVFRILLPYGGKEETGLSPE